MFKTLIADQIGAMLSTPSIRVISRSALPTHAKTVAPSTTYAWEFLSR